MLNNLEKLRKERGVTLVDMADLLHVRYQTVSDKISGTSDFKFQEAVLIQKNFFPEFDLVYLFSNENLSKQTAQKGGENMRYLLIAILVINIIHIIQIEIINRK